jgi:hypothetical protein
VAPPLLSVELVPEKPPPQEVNKHSKIAAANARITDVIPSEMPMLEPGFAPQRSNLPATWLGSPPLLQFWMPRAAG